MRDRFDLTPEQYHAGLDKLWEALSIEGIQKEDVFTISAKEIRRLRCTVAELKKENDWLYQVIMSAAAKLRPSHTQEWLDIGKAHAELLEAAGLTLKEEDDGR